MDAQKLIAAAFHRSMSYAEYRALVASHVEKNTNTGDAVTESLANYTALNHQRMKRLDKTVKLQDHTRTYLENFKKDIYFLVITESWCGDAAQAMPVINKFSAYSTIPLRVVLRDESNTLMSQFLTHGKSAIAKLIVVDKNTHAPLANWGPRPHALAQLVDKEKEENGVLSAAFKESMQVWYNQDKGKSTEQDLTTILRSL